MGRIEIEWKKIIHYYTVVRISTRGCGRAGFWYWVEGRQVERITHLPFVSESPHKPRHYENLQQREVVKTYSMRLFSKLMTKICTPTTRYNADPNQVHGFACGMWAAATTGQDGTPLYNLRKAYERVLTSTRGRNWQAATYYST